VSLPHIEGSPTAVASYISRLRHPANGGAVDPAPSADSSTAAENSTPRPPDAPIALPWVDLAHMNWKLDKILAALGVRQ
jgi:hypothetical protein